MIGVEVGQAFSIVVEGISTERSIFGDLPVLTSQWPFLHRLNNHKVSIISLMVKTDEAGLLWTNVLGLTYKDFSFIKVSLALHLCLRGTSPHQMVTQGPRLPSPLGYPMWNVCLLSCWGRGEGDFHQLVNACLEMTHITSAQSPLMRTSHRKCRGAQKHFGEQYMSPPCYLNKGIIYI